MSALDPDSSFMRAETLNGMHRDAVMCVYHQRLTRIKADKDHPDEQLGYIEQISEDAFTFWAEVTKKPEDRPGRKEAVTQKFNDFFNRVVTYAEYHADDGLSTEAQAKKAAIIEKGKQYQRDLTV